MHRGRRLDRCFLFEVDAWAWGSSGESDSLVSVTTVTDGGGGTYGTTTQPSLAVPAGVGTVENFRSSS